MHPAFPPSLIHEQGMKNPANHKLMTSKRLKMGEVKSGQVAYKRRCSSLASLAAGGYRKLWQWTMFIQEQDRGASEVT
jgi:hypothetical protein